uniref:Uncharacterized protein n=1 Tax=Arundo donax TaxID=35708 RepID=A0A0A9ERJ4_ARUDO
MLHYTTPRCLVRNRNSSVIGLPDKYTHFMFPNTRENSKWAM